MRVVIVDDDKDFLRSLTLLLLKAGHEVISFDDPQAALSFLQSDNRVDALFVDLVLPGFCGGGERLLREADKALGGSTARFVVSGHTEIMAKLDPEVFKIRAFFIKPPDIEAVLAALKDLEDGCDCPGAEDCKGRSG